MKNTAPETLKMFAQEILEEISPVGSDGYKRVIFKHGVRLHRENTHPGLNWKETQVSEVLTGIFHGR